MTHELFPFILQEVVNFGSYNVNWNNSRLIKTASSKERGSSPGKNGWTTHQPRILCTSNCNCFISTDWPTNTSYHVGCLHSWEFSHDEELQMNQAGKNLQRVGSLKYLIKFKTTLHIHLQRQSIDWLLNSDRIARAVYIRHYICLREILVSCLFYCLLLCCVGNCLLILV